MAISIGNHFLRRSFIARKVIIAKPETPTLAAANFRNKKNILTWTDAEGAASYKIYWGTSAGITTASSSIDAGLVNTYEHTGLTNGTTYYYKVAAVGQTGKEGALSSEVSGTPQLNQYAITSDGVDEYILVPDDNSLDITAALSISLWIKESDAGSFDRIISKRSSSNATSSWMIAKQSADGIMFYLYNGSALFTGSFDGAYTPGQWNHLVAVYNGGGATDADKVKIYLNGSGQALSASGTHGATINSTATNVIMFNDSTLGSSSVAGQLDEVSIWNTNLSDAEVTELYNAGDPTDLALHSQYDNLVSWWRFGDDPLDSSAFSGIIRDQKGSNHALPINFEAADITTDEP